MTPLEQNIFQSASQEEPVGPGGVTGGEAEAEFPQKQGPLPETDRSDSPLQSRAQAYLGLSPEVQAYGSVDDGNDLKAVGQATGEQTGEVPSIASGEDSNESYARSGTVVVGRADFSWRRNLSEDGKKLYLLLLKEMGDVDLLPIYATEEEFDLNTALDELREHALLDERDPELIKLVRRTL